MRSLCCRRHRFVLPLPLPPSLFRRASSSSRARRPPLLSVVPPPPPPSLFPLVAHRRQTIRQLHGVRCVDRRRRPLSPLDDRHTSTAATAVDTLCPKNAAVASPSSSAMMTENDPSLHDESSPHWRVSAASRTARPYTVFIEGNVGSGKTTFLEHFADCPNVYAVKEPLHKWQNVRGHNFLGLMYEDPKRWSFAFQSIVQRTMLELHQARPARGQNIKIMERSIYSARNIFVENLYKDNLMAPPEYAVLDAWYKWLIGNVEIESDLIIYLRTDPEVAYQRIKDRNRSEEKDVPFEYIKHLHELHDKWLNVRKTDIPKNTPVVIVDANQSMDLVKKQFKGIRDLITKNASALVESKTSSKISEIGKSINDIQHISPNCKLMPDSTIVPAQRV